MMRPAMQAERAETGCRIGMLAYRNLMGVSLLVSPS
jgi:hypothetical protein